MTQTTWAERKLKRVGKIRKYPTSPEEKDDKKSEVANERAEVSNA
ncbi:hypothetical protein ACQKP5_18245 [Pseudomonas vancouverensis]